MKLGIRQKLLLMMLGTIIVLQTASFFLLVTEEKKTLQSELAKRVLLIKENLVKRAETLGDNLSLVVEESIASYDLYRMTEVINSTVKNDVLLDYVILMNAKSVVFVHTKDPLLAHKKLSSKEDIFALNATEVVYQEYDNKSGSFLELVKPISISVNKWGVLRLAFNLNVVNKEIEKSSKELEQRINEIILQSIFTTFALVFLGAVFVSLFANKIVHPLETLTNTVHLISDGRPHYKKIDVGNSNDEVGILAEAFKRMIQNVTQSHTELEELNATLEEKVKQRTKILEEQSEALILARNEAEFANKSKSMFLANMSHELRTPLNAVIGYSEMLIDQAQDEGFDAITPDLNKINSAGHHLLGLINSILDLSKIEAGKMEVFFEKFKVEDVVNDIIATITPLIEKNENTLSVSISEEVDVLCSDITKVKQMLFNLLSNSSKFTEKGIIYLDVSPCTESKQQWYCFSVKDSGIGMSSEQAEKLFEPFTQADASTTKKYGGTGLGLTICKQFSDLLGGKISVTSEINQGAEFQIKLPIRDKRCDEVTDENSKLSRVDTDEVT